jgi:hypothetical protein
MSRWFRIYDELLDDPKVQRLPAEDFKGWVNLLCLASRNNGKLPCVADIAFALRETEESVSSLLHRLQSGGLLERRGSVLAPYKWAERQYKSDTSTERVKRFRERSRNTDETAPDTEAETEETPIAPTGGRRGKTCLPADWKLPAVNDLPPKARACAEKWTRASYETEGEGFVLYWRSSGRMMKDWNGTWANRVISRNEAVLRAQKFGNAPTDKPPIHRLPMTREELSNAIRYHMDRGDKARVAELQKQLQAKPPPDIARLIKQSVKTA